MTITQGETTYFDVTPENAEDIPSGAVIRLGIKEHPASSVYIYEKELDDDDAVSGVYTFTLTAAETATLAGGRIYYIDVGVQKGTEYHFIGEPAQELEIRPSVTRWEASS